MQLDTSTRAFIAEVLLETLDFEEDFSVSSGWLEEIHRRCAAVDSGTARLVDHESALKQLRARFLEAPDLNVSLSNPVYRRAGKKRLSTLLLDSTVARQL